MRETTLYGLLKEKRVYVLPKYQRGYAWKSDNINDFWRDLVSAVDYKRHHFFGIVYVRDTDSAIRILDGQQRITTTMVFLSCVRSYLLENNVGKRMVTRLNDLLSTNGKQKLVLSKINNSLFQNLLGNKFKTRGDLENALDSDPNRFLYNAYFRLSTNLKSYGKEHGSNSVLDLVEKLLHEFDLYIVQVTDTYNAHTMFNLINDRGIRLEQHELIKSFVFGELDNSPDTEDATVDEVEDCWNKITQNIKKGSNYGLNVFFQHVLNLTTNPKHEKSYQVIKDKDAYKTVCQRILPEQIVDWVKEVKHWSDVVYKLRNPKGRFLNNSKKSRSCEIHLERLFKVGAIAVYPLLMAGYEHYCHKKSDFKSFDALTEACLKYHLRTQTIAKTNVGKYQEHLLKTARKLYRDPSDVHDVIASLKSDLYPSNEKLRGALIDYEPKTRIASVILELIEESYSDKLSHNAVTVEHVMPVTLNKQWIQYIRKNNLDCTKDEAEQLHKRYCGLLGNLTLLNKKQNIGASNSLFATKQTKYKNTDYRITKELSALSRWSEDEINQRHSNFIAKILEIIII